MSDDVENLEERGNDDCCCQKKCMTKIPKYFYEFTNIANEEDATCEEKQETRNQMLNKIRSLDFAVVELAEYLDTHNDDEKALSLHREYANALYEMKEKYQRIYGPLDLYFPCKKWRWVEEPWPWERGSF